jgi:hypothetical protein
MALRRHRSTRLTTRRKLGNLRDKDPRRRCFRNTLYFSPSSYSILQSDPQPAQATDEQGDAQTDIANLAVIVDEMEGTASGSSAPRDSGALVVACIFQLKSGFRY